jgi:predicted PhzF superfamily epimerase YddE/YHI9
MAGLEATLSLCPDLVRLKAFCLESAIDLVPVYSREVSDRRNAFRTRVFAPTYGYLEDPATGTGNAALGCHLIRNRMWDGSLISLEQNASADAQPVKILAAATGEWPSAVAPPLRIDGEYILT